MRYVLKNFDTRLYECYSYNSDVRSAWITDYKHRDVISYDTLEAASKRAERLYRQGLHIEIVEIDDQSNIVDQNAVMKSMVDALQEKLNNIT